MKVKHYFFLLLIPLLLFSCNSYKQKIPVETISSPIVYPVGYIAQYLTTDLYDDTELYELSDDFLENFMQRYDLYEGTHPIMPTEFPDEWGVVLVERFSEGRELYQIQSQNREWVYLVITSGYGTQRILDVLPVAVNLANQTQDVLETEIWITEKEIDGTFIVEKTYEWKRSLENVTQKEYEENPTDYFRSQTIRDKYFINDFYRFERIFSEDVPEYSAVIFYYKNEKPDDNEEVLSMIQAFCEDYEILFAEVNHKFDQIDLFDYKLNYIVTLDITPFIDFQEGLIFIKKGETPKTVHLGNYDRLKIEVKRYFRIVEV